VGLLPVRESIQPESSLSVTLYVEEEVAVKRPL
jgi:hypothetical protein